MPQIYDNIHLHLIDGCANLPALPSRAHSASATSTCADGINWPTSWTRYLAGQKMPPAAYSSACTARPKRR